MSRCPVRSIESYCGFQLAENVSNTVSVGSQYVKVAREESMEIHGCKDVFSRPNFRCERVDRQRRSDAPCVGYRASLVEDLRCNI
jgi:hypothetical protein